MTQHTISLIDVLAPPANRWLKELSRRKANLPVGVRVVRFSDGDDGADLSDDVVGTINPRSPENTDSICPTATGVANSDCRVAARSALTIVRDLR